MDSDAGVVRQFRKLLDKSKRERYVLRLFIAGMTARSAGSIAMIKSVCETHLAGRYELEVIDIYQQPELTKEYQILAVPTLVRKAPGPVRLLIGELTDMDKVVRALEIRANS